MASGNLSDAFKTHSAYIRAFARLVAPGVPAAVPALQAVATAFETIPSLSATSPNANGALNSLSIAWRTELLLDWTAAALPDDNFARIANTWAVIQVYYVFYHCTQALAQAKGFPRPQSHPKTQQMFCDYWAQRPLNLPPWTLAVGSAGTRNVPQGIQIDEGIHPWAACDQVSCWSLAAKALRTTRQDVVTAAINAKRSEGQRARKREWDDREAKRVQDGRAARTRPSFSKPILSAEEKSEIDQGIRPFTVMDYLYRLRIRTNYREAAMFTDGPVEEGESQAVRTHLRRVCSATLLLHELAVARLIGGDSVRRHADTFLTNNAPSSIFIYLRERRPLLAGIP